MRRNARMNYGLLAGLLVLAAVTFGPGDPPSHAVKPATLPAANIAPAGYRVAIDPSTGLFVQPQPGALASDALNEMYGPLSRSSEGLVERDNPIAGGKMVDLQGRFQNTFVATIGNDGRMTIECETTSGVQSGGEDDR